MGKRIPGSTAAAKAIVRAGAAECICTSATGCPLEKGKGGDESSCRRLKGHPFHSELTIKADKAEMKKRWERRNGGGQAAL